MQLLPERATNAFCIDVTQNFHRIFKVFARAAKKPGPMEPGIMLGPMVLGIAPGPMVPGIMPGPPDMKGFMLVAPPSAFKMPCMGVFSPRVTGSNWLINTPELLVIGY